jgi:hypothetical protein
MPSKLKTYKLAKASFTQFYTPQDNLEIKKRLPQL